MNFSDKRPDSKHCQRGWPGGCKGSTLIMNNNGAGDVWKWWCVNKTLSTLIGCVLCVNKTLLTKTGCMLYFAEPALSAQTDSCYLWCS